MLKKFKEKLGKLLSKKDIESEKKEKIELNLKELKEKISEKEKEIFKELNNEDFLQEVLKLVEKIKTENIILRKIDLSEKKEKERVKTIVLKNKNNLCDEIENFYQRAENEINKKENSEKLAKSILNLVEILNKNTSKSYSKAAYLIGKEIQNVVDSIYELKKHCSNFLKKNSETIKKKEKLSKLKNLLNQFHTKNNSKKVVEKILLELSKQITNFEQKRKENLKEIENLEKSSDYKKMIDLQEKIENNENLLRRNKEKINGLINSKLLERFIHSRPDKKMSDLASEYLANPEKTLLKDVKDNSFEIISILKKAIETIKSEEENIDPKKRKKLISDVSLDKSRFKELADERNKLFEQQFSYKKEIQIIKDKLNIEKIQENTENLNEKIQDAKDEKNKYKSSLDKIEKELKEIKTNIQNSFLEIFQKNLELKKN